jgi:hypothetical protein
MMISADLRMSMGLVANLRAIVAVMLASTLAFTPLPNPSESTETMRPSSFTFSERNTSPEIICPCFARWQKSTSMKFSSEALTSTSRIRCHPAHPG